MSQQIVCDLCGKRIERGIAGETNYQVGVISRKTIIVNQEVRETDYDFCEDCMEKIKAKVKELKHESSEEM